MREPNWKFQKKLSHIAFKKYVGEKVDIYINNKLIRKGVIPFFIGENLIGKKCITMHSEARNIIWITSWEHVKFKISTHERGKNYGE